MNKHWIKYGLIIGISLLLYSCDNSDKDINRKPANADRNVITIVDVAAAPSSNAQGVIATSQNTAEATDEPPQESVSNEPASYSQTPSLVVLDSSEVTLAGISTLVVRFSQPLAKQQDFNHLLSLVEDGKGEVDGSWQLSANGLELHHRYLAPNRNLTLHIDKMLSASDGQTLNITYQRALTTRNRPPMVGFTSNGSLLPSKSMIGLPITTLNVNRIDINFFRIKTDKIYDFLQHYGSVTQLSVWSVNDALSYAELAYSARFNLTPKANVEENVIIDLSAISELKREGTYVAVLNRAGNYQLSTAITTFSISNIGIAVHAYERGQFSIFAHQLDNGQALANIELTALCSSRRDQCNAVVANTDSQGYAAIHLNPDIPYRILMASDGEQMSFVYLDRNALDLSEFNLTGGPFYHKQLFTFGPRNRYHPQETVYLNALLRDADGKMVPEQPIKAEIINPEGQVIKDFVWRAVQPSSGFYQTEFTIPNNAAIGQWAFKFNLGDDSYRYAYFSVEAVLPERIAMLVEPAQTEPILINQDALFTLKSWYLYGAPASGNQLQVSSAITRQRSVAQQPDFKIGSVTEPHIARQLDTIARTLNIQGIAQIDIAHQNWSEIRSPINLDLQIKVLDAGGRPVSRTISQSIWPVEHMPAIRPLFAKHPYYDWSKNDYSDRPTVDIGQSASFEIAYMDRKGQQLASPPLTVRVVKERRDYYWSWTDHEGWQTKHDEQEFILSSDTISVAANGVAKFSFLANDYGAYRLEVIDPNTHAISSVRFWCGYSWSDNTDPTGAIHPDQVKLSLDRPVYQVGDTATVHIEAPVSGAGYLSLETNEGTLWMQEINVTAGGIDVAIPIKEWRRHDIYINVMIIRPGLQQNIQTIKRAIGLLYLPIDTSSRQLQLTIDAPATTNPEKVVKVKLHVANKPIKDRQITVLVSAVANDILAASNFTTPDPYSAFLGRKGYYVDQFDVYGKLIEGRGRHVGMSFGGDGEQVLRQTSKKTLTQAASMTEQFHTVELDAQGDGEIELAIADFNGQLRIMAQAWDSDRFGRADKIIAVTASVSAEMALPPFLTSGDQTLLALQVGNLSDSKQYLNLQLDTQGLIALATNQKLVSVALAPHEQRIIQIPVLAGEGFGQGEMRVKIDNIQLADGDDLQLSRSWQVAVRPAYRATASELFVTLNAGERWRLPASALAGLIDDTVEAQLVLSHNPILNIRHYVEALYANSYGGLEPIISQLYPALYANAAQLEKIGINADTDEVRRKNVQTGIDRLFSLQRNNGSFGFWSNDSQEEYWLTAYGVDFLLRAKERGYQINSAGLTKAINRLEHYLYDPTVFYNLNNNYSSDIQSYIEFATKSYAAFILTRQNQITPAMRNELKRLYQQVNSHQHSASLSALPIMQLAIASRLTGNQRSADDLLAMALTTKRDRQHDWLGDYGSAIRDTAQLYNLMVEYQLASASQASYLLALVAMLDNQPYLSTQELSALFQASWNSLALPQPAAVAVLLNNQQQLTSATTIYQQLDFNQLASGLSVHNAYNALPVYLLFSLSGYHKSLPPATSPDNVLQISRHYLDRQGKPIELNQLNVGDVVVVKLDISADRLINDALVVDRLPAGLALENPNLATNSLDILAITDAGTLLNDLANHGIKHQEFRSDRYVAAIAIDNQLASDRYRSQLTYVARAVTVGKYVVPAPYVESMYMPQWYATGQTHDSLTIVSKQP